MEIMKCDRCHSDQNEVLILRKSRFVRDGKPKTKFQRVCFRCAKHLVKHRIYNLGHYWMNVLEAVTHYK